MARGDTLAAKASAVADVGERCSPASPLPSPPHAPPARPLAEPSMLQELGELGESTLRCAFRPRQKETP